MGDPGRAAKPWAKTSARTGDTSPLSRMGGCRVPVLEDRDHQGEDEPTHWLMLGDAETGQERDPAQRPQPRSEQRPQGSDSGSAAKPSARPVERGSGWRSSTYQRPANGTRQAYGFLVAAPRAWES